jgi:hypothetical protein
VHDRSHPRDVRTGSSSDQHESGLTRDQPRLRRVALPLARSSCATCGRAVPERQKGDPTRPPLRTNCRRRARTGPLPPALRPPRHQRPNHSPPRRPNTPPRSRRRTRPQTRARPRRRPPGHRYRPRHRRAPLHPPHPARQELLAQPEPPARPLAKHPHVTHDPTQVRPMSRLITKRRGRDSNPRWTERPTTVFETAPTRPQCRITTGVCIPGECRGE